MCGVVGVLGRDGDDVLAEIVNGLVQMQHRGQDAAGIALSDGRRLRLHRGMGYVQEVFRERPEPEFQGHAGIGHVRYPTQGANRLDNAQPHVVSTLAGPTLAMCSNGDLTNYWQIRGQLEAAGIAFDGTNDAELLLKYTAYWHIRGGFRLIDALRATQRDVRGAYSAVLVTRDTLYAVRDPYGVRPLSFGGGSDRFVVASETQALDIARVDLVGDVAPGEIVRFNASGVQRFPHPDVVGAREGLPHPAHCSFEHVYFSRPDSITFGQRTYDVRKRIGAWLAEHDTVRGDVVVPVPDSSNAVALGYAQAAGLPFEFGLVRNHYVGRTFIEPDQPRREEKVKLKFNPLRSVFKDRQVILVDDSIVRGTTSRKLVRMVRQAGAAGVHLRIGSPMTTHSCFYGVDTPDEHELIANQMTCGEICAYLTADSLAYMTIDGLKECIGDRGDFCLACFDGRYPIPLVEAKLSRDVVESPATGTDGATEAPPTALSETTGAVQPITADRGRLARTSPATGTDGATEAPPTALSETRRRATDQDRLKAM